MNNAPEWWTRQRRVSVVVDNDSWELPFAERLAAEIISGGDKAALCRDHDAIGEGEVAYYLGCVQLTPPDVLARNRRNLVVHASGLPRGRGFSPLTWQILEGVNDIPVCLLEAAEEADAGAVIYRDAIAFKGDELIEEMRAALGEKTIELCRRFLAEAQPPEGVPQTGEASHYARRGPDDSRLDPDRPIADQFNLLRTVDNDRYPAFFDLKGHRYRLRIDKWDGDDG